MQNPTPHLRVLLAAVMLMAGACTPAEDSDLPPLPEDSDTLIPEDTGPFEIPEDTDNVGPADLEPANYLYLYQEGSLRLTPNGGPYTALTGTMTVLELVDFQLPEPDPEDTDPPDTDPPWSDLEESPVACEVSYSLVGAPPPEEAGAALCDGCTWMIDVTFAVASGDPEPCYDPDLPADGETLRFAWNPTSGQLLYDFQDTGVWFPWYPGSEGADTVDFTFRARLGVSIEEDEDDQ